REVECRNATSSIDGRDTRAPRTCGARASLGSNYLDERRAVRDREAAFRVPALRAVPRFAVVFRLAVERFAAVLRFAVDFLAVDFRLPVDFRFAVVFRFAVERFAVDLRAVVLRAAVFFLAAAFFFVPDFLAADFLAVDFFFREDPERELELFAELRLEERVPERDEERVVAGTARATSAISSVLPIADSPHASSAVVSASAVGLLHEPAFGVSDASPVPLQSSWVM